MGTLVLVYDADGDLFSRVTDFAHKLLAPGSYACDLCAVTYGPVGMRHRWRDVLDGLGCPVRFLHRDEFDDADVPLPAILWEEDGTRGVLLSAEAISACAAAEDPLGALEAALRSALGGRC